MLTLLFAALILPAASTWTVDDDGPADFTQITDAIVAALPGDVLLVETGTYLDFGLDKRLSILGRTGVPRPHVTGLTRVTAGGFTLAGLDFDALRVVGVAGRGRIDDCSGGEVGDGNQLFALVIDGCAQVVVSRTRVRGSAQYSDTHYYAGGAAMQIRTANVTLVDCRLEGAQGFSEGGSGGYGGTGLVVADGSRATVVTSFIHGGWEGWSSNCFMYLDGPSGTGLKVTQSLVVARGAPGHPNAILAGPVDGSCGDTKLPAVDIAQGTVLISGVAFNPDEVKLTDGVLIQPPVPEPVVVVGGTYPRSQSVVHLHGPAGAMCLLTASLLPAYVPLGQFDDKLWVGVSGSYLLIPVVTAGQDSPIVLTFPISASLASLEGQSIELQPLFPGFSSALEAGKSVAGNVAEIIFRF